METKSKDNCTTVRGSASDSRVTVKPLSFQKAKSDKMMESKSKQNEKVDHVKTHSDVDDVDKEINTSVASKDMIVRHRGQNKTHQSQKTGNESDDDDEEIKDKGHPKPKQSDLADISSRVNDSLTPCENVDVTWKETKIYYICLLLVTAVAIFTRFYNIEIPAHICWDETHFGKMGSWYINRTFFFDVHPPFGKMLIGFAGYLTGYNGSFPFSKPGVPYEEEVQYVGMRMFCGALGTALIPLSYQIVWHLTHSYMASIFASCFILFDTGTLVLTRYILLDPPLLFFIMTSIFCCVKFLSFRLRPFSSSWLIWLMLTGASLACALGVKFVGLFTVLMVGYTTAFDLWNLLADLSLSMRTFCRHVAARVMGLIILPILVYCLFFSIHFDVLYKSGNGDGFFSSAFQSSLVGNRLHNVSMPQYVAFGSVITLKQRRTGGGYLHSHLHLYPEEHPPKQQQVTTYSHKDSNNQWLVKPAQTQPSPTDPVEYVRSGDVVRLEHVPTRRNLHSHKEKAPLSKRQYQVSGYGQNGTGDANDFWKIEIVGGNKGDLIEAVKPKLRFIHYNINCVLHAHDKKLPKWGWEQQEVTCNPSIKNPISAWNVEEIVDSRLPNISFNVYSLSFFEKFLESHAVMTQSNSGLKPKEGEVTSRPWQWPIDFKGQVFSGQDHRVYLLGNPILFWFLLGAKGLFVFVWVIFIVLKKRKVQMVSDLEDYCRRTFKVCWWLLFGWFIHYTPFWPMTRVLYFHHYFPAFLFSAMFGGVFLNFLITYLCVCVPKRYAAKLFHWSVLLTLAGIIYSFYLFHPLAYGMSGPMANNASSSMHKLKWMESWDI